MGGLVADIIVVLYSLGVSLRERVRNRNGPSVKLRYSSPLDVEIEGTQVDFSAIADRIRALATTGAGKIRFPGHSKGSPAPYNIWLESLVICVGAGKLVVSVDRNRKLKITGDAANVQTLASYFAFPPGAPDGHHYHLEYHPGDEWIAETSIPIVISISGTRG